MARKFPATRGSWTRTEKLAPLPVDGGAEVGNGDVGEAVPVDVGDDDGIGPCPGGEGGGGEEVPRGKGLLEEDLDQARAGGGEVGNAVAVQVADGHGEGAPRHGQLGGRREEKRSPEGRVLEEDVHAVGHGNGDIGQTIAVQVADGNGKGTRAAGKIDGGEKGPRPGGVVEEDRNGAGAGVSDGQIQEPVAVQVGGGHPGGVNPRGEGPPEDEEPGIQRVLEEDLHLSVNGDRTGEEGRRNSHVEPPVAVEIARHDAVLPGGEGGAGEGTIRRRIPPSDPQG